MPAAADASAKHIARQLVRAATGGGANYEEAHGAESRADFIHKVGIGPAGGGGSSGSLVSTHRVDHGPTRRSNHGRPNRE